MSLTLRRPELKRDLLSPAVPCCLQVLCMCVCVSGGVLGAKKYFYNDAFLKEVNREEYFMTLANDRNSNISGHK